MDTPETSPEALGQKVSSLFVNNRPVFAEQIEAFWLEGAALLAAEKKAEEAERAAGRAIGEEREAVRAGKAKPRLTDPDTSPGDGWTWRRVNYVDEVGYALGAGRVEDEIYRTLHGHPVTAGYAVDAGRVEGWLPPDVASHIREGPADWPANPSRATMFALLAAFHDVSDPHCKQILPAAAVLARRKQVNKLLLRIKLCTWVAPATGRCHHTGREGAERLATLWKYLDHVAEDLATGGRAAQAREIVEICDQLLALGRSSAGPEDVPAVGSYSDVSGPSGFSGRMGMSGGDEWENLANEFDRLASRAVVLVRALDPAYDTGVFFTPAPVSLLEAYPKTGTPSITDMETLREVCLLRGKTDEQAAACVAMLERACKKGALNAVTKRQWPGRVIDEVTGAYRLFFSDPELVRAFDQRFGALKAWAEARQQEESSAPNTPDAAATLSKDARALAALADHPDWTDKQIAKAAGCNVKSLYRMKSFTTAKAALKQGRDDMPKGSKSKEGEVEAWQPGEGPDDGGSLNAQYK
jgi:hypothetical protein